LFNVTDKNFAAVLWAPDDVIRQVEYGTSVLGVAAVSWLLQRHIYPTISSVSSGCQAHLSPVSLSPENEAGDAILGLRNCVITSQLRYSSLKITSMYAHFARERSVRWQRNCQTHQARFFLCQKFGLLQPSAAVTPQKPASKKFLLALSVAPNKQEEFCRRYIMKHCSG